MSTCLTQRPSVCMLYWLLLPQPRSIDRKLWPVNRAANPACLWIFFFFFLVAASDVKGCLSRLCVLGSLAGSQAAAHCVQSHCGAAEVTRLREGWGKAVRALWSSPHAAHHGYWCWGCVSMVKACIWSCVYVRMDQSPTRSRTIGQFERAHVRLWGQTTTMPCSCVEPGPAWLSCNITELRDWTDESLEVNTVFQVFQNVSTELSNSVLNFFWSFFLPITFSFCVACSLQATHDVIYFLLCVALPVIKFIYFL